MESFKRVVLHNSDTGQAFIIEFQLWDEFVKTFSKQCAQHSARSIDFDFTSDISYIEAKSLTQSQLTEHHPDILIVDHLNRLYIPAVGTDEWKRLKSLYRIELKIYPDNCYEILTGNCSTGKLNLPCQY